jgi:hypothetical protein
MYIYKFPFDQQTCKFTMGSWFQSNKDLKLNYKGTYNPLNSMDFIKNPIWNLINVSFLLINNSRINYFSAEELTFIAVLKRQPLYYMINNVYPCLILNMVTLVTYFLPFSLQASLSIRFLFIFVKFCLYN